MYAEHPAAAKWRADVACVWTSVTGHGAGVVVPDGSADLLWSSERGLSVVGPMTRPSEPQFGAGTEHIGVRLQPGHASRVLGVPAPQLRDRVVVAADVLGVVGRRLAERLDAARGVLERRRIMETLPELAPSGDTDAVALAALAWVTAEPGRRVDEAAEHVGCSPRQLQRRVVTAIGYGPKRFQRVVRVQRLLALGPPVLGDLARVAADLGFADQSHLGREVRQLTGRSTQRALVSSRATMVSETS